MTALAARRHILEEAAVQAVPAQRAALVRTSRASLPTVPRPHHPPAHHATLTTSVAVWLRLPVQV